MTLAITFVIDYRRIRWCDAHLTGVRHDDAVNRICVRAGSRLRRTAFRLQGVIVKAGQFLSMRQDILPAAFTNELAALQDKLPQASFKSVQSIVESELGQPLKNVFRAFNHEAVAAASLAQVHRALLQDGSAVAVKVLRPNMDKLAEADLKVLRILARITDRFPSKVGFLNFTELHREFTETIHKELDCREEVRHMRRFAQMFANNPRIVVPRVYDNLVTQRVLVMEYVAGANVYDFGRGDSRADRQNVAALLLDAYLKQLLVYGFIHVDPHPGNLLVLPNGRICFLDFGMVDELAAQEVSHFRLLVQAFAMHSDDGVISALSDLGFVRDGTDTSMLKDVLQAMFAHMNQRNGASAPELSSVAAGLKTLLQKSPIRLQAKYMFLVRATGILITVLNRLAPEANWADILMEHTMEVLMSPVAR